MRNTLLSLTLVVFCGAVTMPAQESKSPPPIIRVFVEQLKPGRTAAHEKSEASFVRAMTKANFPTHYLALTAMAGANEVWFLEEHSSFAEIEEDEKLTEQPPLKAEFEQLDSTDGEFLAGSRSMLGVYRSDLSYRAEDAIAGLPKLRYAELSTLRIKPGSESRLAGAVRDMSNIYNNIQFKQPILVYQLLAGAQHGTFLIIEPFTTLAEWDKFPAIMKAMRETGGRKFDAAEAAFNDVMAFSESRLMAINPAMSYVSKETISGDPGFWAPKPKMAETKPAPRAARKPPGGGQ